MKKLIDTKDLCLADDICIPIAFDGDTEAVQYMVRTILSRDDITVEKVETQKRIGSIASRSAVLDILAHDSSGNLIDIEIQRAFHGWDDLAVRAESYASLMLLSSLERGMEYRNAKEAIIIFIMDRDMPGSGKPTYIYRMADEDGNRLQGSRMTIVLANGSYRDTIETEISRLYSDLYETELGKIRRPEMRKCLGKVKGDEGMLSTERGYSVIEKIKAEGYKEGFEEGFKIGLKKSRMKIAMRMIAAGFPSSTIADITELSAVEIEKLKKELEPPQSITELFQQAGEAAAR